MCEPADAAAVHRIAFRGRPAVVDLTPAAKVAERVAEAQVRCLALQAPHLALTHVQLTLAYFPSVTQLHADQHPLLPSSSTLPLLL